MIKLICTKCGCTWYTANTVLNQKCDSCGGVLIEEGENKNTDLYERKKKIKKAV